MPRPWPYITQQDATAQVRDSPYIKLRIPAWSPQNHSQTQFCPLTHEQRLRLRPPTTHTVGSSAAVVFPHAPSPRLLVVRHPTTSTAHPADKRTHSRPIAAVVPRSQHAPSPSGESTTSTHTRHSRALHHVARSTWHCPRHTRRSRFIVKIVTQQTRSHTSLCCSHSLDSGRHDLWTHYDPDVRPAASKRGRSPTQSRPLAAVALWSPRAPSSMMESPRPAPTRVTPEHTVMSPGNITSPPTHTSSALHCSSIKQKRVLTRSFLLLSQP